MISFLCAPKSLHAFPKRAVPAPQIPVRNFAVDPFCAMLGAVLLYPLATSALDSYNKRKIVAIERANPSKIHDKIGVLLKARLVRVEKLPTQFPIMAEREKHARIIDEETIEEISQMIEGKTPESN